LKRAPARHLDLAVHGVLIGSSPVDFTTGFAAVEVRNSSSAVVANPLAKGADGQLP
jgi:hypothetical protein